jgi:hypothetical protein
MATRRCQGEVQEPELRRRKVMPAPSQETKVRVRAPGRITGVLFEVGGA